MMQNKSPQIIPMLSYERGVVAMEWLCRVFGFIEKIRMVGTDGRLEHGEIMMGDGIVMLATPSPDYQNPKHHRELCKDTAKFYEVPYIINGVLVYVDDVNTHFLRSKEGGAIILSEPEEGFPGLRYRAEDIEGQRWMFMQK